MIKAFLHYHNLIDERVAYAVDQLNWNNEHLPKLYSLMNLWQCQMLKQKLLR